MIGHSPRSTLFPYPPLSRSDEPPAAPPAAPPEDGDLLAELLPDALPELPELLGELGLEVGALLPPVALPLFALVSEVEPAPAFARVHGAMLNEVAKVVRDDGD